MKKIDLTYPMRRATKKAVTLPTLPTKVTLSEEAKAKLQSHPLFAQMNTLKANADTLKKEVLNALANYTSGTIAEAEEIFSLAEYLRDNPTCEISNAKFALIEKAIATSNVEVKVTWNTMINELNKEG